MEKQKKKSWKKTLAIVAFILLNVVVIVATAVNEFGNSTNAAELSEVQINGWWLVPAVLSFAVATLANIYKYVIMIRRSSEEGAKMSAREIWKISWQVVMLGKYYDNVTPAAIGGQPFQVYYMRKNSNLKAGDATSIPIVAMVVGQIAFLILAIVFFLVGNPMYDNPVLMVPAWLGLLFFAFWPLMMFGVNFFPKATAKFINFFVRILAKVKIVKNRDEAVKRVETETSDYVKSVKHIMKTRGLFVQTIILATIYQFFIAIIPFFVLRAFGGNVGFVECLSTTLAVTSAVYFIPTPGNAGVAEGTFYVVFSVLSAGYVFWAMLLWRFFTYYIYIILGGLTFFAINVEKRKKTKELKEGMV